MAVIRATANKFKSRVSMAGLALICVLLSACKIVVIVPEGGKVVSADGFICNSGETCEIEVTDDTFTSTFTAMAEEGYAFARWKKVQRGFCGNTTSPCRLSTEGANDHSWLLNIINSDDEAYLVPVFVNFDLTYWRQVLKDIEDGVFTTDSYLYSNQPIVDQCDPGSLKAGPKNRVLEATNRTRALHGLPAVDYNASYNMQVQEASLVQRANNYLSHFPQPGDNCYSQSAADGAVSSNIFGGSQGFSDPAADVFGWTNDNRNIASLMAAGHRRWMLFPELGYVSYGQVEGYSALKVIDFGVAPNYDVPGNLAFVALPYKAYPYNLVTQDPDPTPWSISMVPQNGEASSFNYFASATVTIVETATNQALTVHSVYKDSDGFGLANFLSWMVDDWRYDTEYTVTINNVQMPGGGSQSVEYPVMIDRYDLLNIDYPREAQDGMTGSVLEGKFDDVGDKDAYVIKLTGETGFNGTSEFSGQGYFILVYDRDKNLVASYDQQFTQTFSKGRYTVVLSHCDENGLCYQGTQTYRVTVN